MSVVSRSWTNNRKALFQFILLKNAEVGYFPSSRGHVFHREIWVLWSPVKMAAPPDEQSLESRISKSNIFKLQIYYILMWHWENQGHVLGSVGALSQALCWAQMRSVMLLLAVELLAC